MQQRFDRSAGILMPVSSLPSPYGIGSFGKSAYDFVDNLVAARQKFWQILPLGPTSFGDSPYASFSAFAGNPYFIDLDKLVEEGLLESDYVHSFMWNMEEQYVDYGLIYNSRFQVLRTAFKNSSHQNLDEYKTFFKENEYWLEGYCLYSACKNKFEGTSWTDWESEIKFRDEESVQELKEELKDDIEFYKFVQYKFYEQWNQLKEYANDKEIEIIGDIPLYVAMDSADVWQHTEFFQLDEELNPTKVAGVPPDVFSETGQRWGNPLYDWKKLEAEDFSWWRKRMEHSARLYDVIRIDHFIGMVKYYAIPAEDEDARNGAWEKGPGLKLIQVMNESIGDKKIIAEDLGVQMPEVVKVLEKSGYPGMKVLEFAFDGNRKNDHLPYYWTQNTVAYGGTHDNDTLMGYFTGLQSWELGYVREYMECRNGSIEDLVDKIFRTAYASVADLVIFQMQDVLKVGNIGRMNLPSSMGTNWRWRMLQGQFGPEEIEKLRYLCDIYGR
ncbi:MAG: 4-alpha-glucanotransferase [Eubacterium sp.]|jgi:4-alpha-glucanotransferase|nr:4-alpha-glucanotransferase [Eubacterium sp.]